MEHDRHSRSHLAFQKGAAIAFVVAGAAVIVLALFSLRAEVSRLRGSKKSSAPVMIAVLGVFVSLAGSAFFAESRSYAQENRKCRIACCVKANPIRTSPPNSAFGGHSPTRQVQMKG